MTTIGEWLATRTPAPPHALAARLREVLGGDLDAPALEAHARCLTAGERLLAELVARDATSRAAALDLLVADALVTYAFEAAAEHPAELEARADEAMAQLSAVGESG